MKLRDVFEGHIHLTAYHRDGRSLFSARAGSNAEVGKRWSSLDGHPQVHSVVAHNTRTREVVRRRPSEGAPSFHGD